MTLRLHFGPRVIKIKTQKNVIVDLGQSIYKILKSDEVGYTLKLDASRGFIVERMKAHN